MLRVPDDRARRPDAPEGRAAANHRRPSSALPWWVRAADALVLTMLAIWLRLLLVGPIRMRVLDVRIGISSPLELGIGLAVVLAARHALCRDTPLHARLAGWFRRWRREPNSGAVIAAAVASRLVILLVGVLAIASFELPAGFDRMAHEPLTFLAARWDATWYLRIVEWGYQYAPDGRQYNVTFFPALPIGIGALAAVLRWNPLHAGVLLSILAFAAAATYLYRTARESVDADAALGAVWLLAAYPASLFYSVPYTESLYLLGVLATLFHFARDQWARAAFFGVVTGLTRPNGCLLSVVLAIVILVESWHARRDGRPAWTRRRWLQLAIASTPGLGMMAFSAYLYSQFGDPLLWLKGQAAWGREYTDLVGLASGRATDLHSRGVLAYVFRHPLEFVNMAAAVFGLAMIVPVTVRLGLAYGAFVALGIVPPLVMGGTTSLARMTSTLFPVFILLAAWCNPAWRMSLLVVFAMLQGVAAAMFFTWRPMF